MAEVSCIYKGPCPFRVFIHKEPCCRRPLGKAPPTECPQYETWKQQKEPPQLIKLRLKTPPSKPGWIDPFAYVPPIIPKLTAKKKKKK